MRKPPEQILKQALESLGDLSAPDEPGSSVEDYDDGAEVADKIAALALQVLSAAREIVADREKHRADFIADLAEADALSTDPEAVYGVSGQFRVR